MSSSSLAFTVEQRPSILLLDIKTNLEPVVSFLTNKLSLDKRSLAAVLSGVCLSVVSHDASGSVRECM
jgi:hypothetical protein